MFKFGPLQTKWLKLLESGRFDQVRGSLCEINVKTGVITGFCCLGIAEAGVMKTKPKVFEHRLSDHIRYDDTGFLSQNVEVSFNSCYRQLSPSTQKVMKFRSELGKGTDGTNLAMFNDTGKTFKQIAAIIRKDPECYFTDPA